MKLKTQRVDAPDARYLKDLERLKVQADEMAEEVFQRQLKDWNEVKGKKGPAPQKNNNTYLQYSWGARAAATIPALARLILAGETTATLHELKGDKGAYENERDNVYFRNLDEIVQSSTKIAWTAGRIKKARAEKRHMVLSGVSPTTMFVVYLVSQVSIPSYLMA